MRIIIPLRKVDKIKFYVLCAEKATDTSIPVISQLN
jgi:hypothetical protein